MGVRLLRSIRSLACWRRCGLLLLALCLPAGCALVDQNTFAPAPEAKAPAAPARPQPAASAPALGGSRRALVIIDYSTPAPAYHDLLRYAVKAAEARDRHVQYDVVALVPHVGSAAQGQHDASQVMHAIMADGVPASRIHLGLSTDPGLSSRQVRIYLR